METSTVQQLEIGIFKRRRFPVSNEIVYVIDRGTDEDFNWLARKKLHLIFRMKTLIPFALQILMEVMNKPW